MKNTLLALMLVSSLFVISCGADATKPGDAYKNQPTETTTGTATVYANVTADASGALNTINIENLKTQQYNSTIAAGTKITEIVQVVTETTDSAQGTTTTTTNTNAVTAIQKNADGGIYQFTIDSTTATTSTTAYVTYKYIQREAAPTVEKETTGTYAGSTSPLTMDASFTDKSKAFEKDIISITDKNGIQLNRGTDYSYSDVTDAVTINKTGYLTEDAFTVRYSYRDISMISEKPLTGDVTDAAGGVPGGTTATIPLDAALYAGRSYYLKAVITDTQAGSGGTPTPTPTTETIYYNKIVPSTGIIDITLTTITKPSATTTTGTYEIWVY